MYTYFFFKRKKVLRNGCVLASTTRKKFPQDQGTCVHVNSQEGVSVKVNGAFQYFRCHVSTSAHLKISLLFKIIIQSNMSVSDLLVRVYLQQVYQGRK